MYSFYKKYNSDGIKIDPLIFNLIASELSDVLTWDTFEKLIFFKYIIRWWNRLLYSFDCKNKIFMIIIY